MCVHQLDVESAFIYGPLHEDVYMHPHPAMNIPCGYCVELLKSLYDLKQSQRNWNTHLHEFILSMASDVVSWIIACILVSLSLTLS